MIGDEDMSAFPGPFPTAVQRHAFLKLRASSGIGALGPSVAAQTLQTPEGLRAAAGVPLMLPPAPPPDLSAFPLAERTYRLQRARSAAPGSPL